MKRTIFLLTLIIAILCNSCTSINTLIVDIEKPPVLTLPPTANSIVFVNNSVVQPDSIGHSEILSNNIKALKRASSDSIDIYMMEGLATAFQTNNQIESVYIYEYPTRTDNNFKEVIPLNQEQIKQITKETNSDVLISVDKILFTTKSNKIRPGLRTEIENLNLNIEALFQIYSSKGNSISPPITLSDSLFWEQITEGKKIETEPLPSMENVMKIGAVYLAENISSFFSPSWDSQARQYYNNGKAKQKIEANQWNEAKSIWIDQFEKEKNSKKKGRLAHNIAFASEMSDDIKEALKWIQIACNLFSENESTRIDKNYTKNATAYKNILIERFNDFKILDLKKQ